MLTLNMPSCEGLCPCKYSTKVIVVFLSFSICAACLLCDHISQTVCHVNVIGLESGLTWPPPACCCLSNACWVQSCVCVRLHNCMHSSLPPCAYCAGLSVHGHIFWNYTPNNLPCQGSAFLLVCQSAVTARMSRESKSAACQTIISALIL